MQIKERVQRHAIDVEAYDSGWLRLQRDTQIGYQQVAVPQPFRREELSFGLSKLKTRHSQREAAELLQGFIKKHSLTAMTSLLDSGTLRFEFRYPDFTCWLNKYSEFWIKKEDEQDHPELAETLLKPCAIC